MMTRPALSLVILACLAAPAQAADGGYAGVIPGAQPTPPDQKQGYSGLIPGKVPEKPAQKQTPAATAVDDSVQSAEDLKQAANNKRMEEESRDIVKPAPEDWTGYAPPPRIDNESPAVFGTRQVIESNMALLSAKGLSPAERQKTAKMVYDLLVSMKEGFQSYTAIPDETYAQMNAPQSYVKEERDTARQSIKMIDAAIAVLRKYM